MLHHTEDNFGNLMLMVAVMSALAGHCGDIVLRILVLSPLLAQTLPGSWLCFSLVACDRTIPVDLHAVLTSISSSRAPARHIATHSSSFLYLTSPHIAIYIHFLQGIHSNANNNKNIFP